MDPLLPVQWDIELASFDKAPNWHQMDAGERIKVSSWGLPPLPFPHVPAGGFMCGGVQ